ncbi:hypothetical protein ACP70R_048340 [Stipagrostis hirtigluma subsp. patula]
MSENKPAEGTAPGEATTVSKQATMSEIKHAEGAAPGEASTVSKKIKETAVRNGEGGNKDGNKKEKSGNTSKGVSVGLMDHLKSKVEGNSLCITVALLVVLLVVIVAACLLGYRHLSLDGRGLLVVHRADSISPVGPQEALKVVTTGEYRDHKKEEIIDVLAEPAWRTTEENLRGCTKQASISFGNSTGIFKNAKVDELKYAMDRYLYLAIVRAAFLDKYHKEWREADVIKTRQVVGRLDVQNYMSRVFHTMDFEVDRYQKASTSLRKMNGAVNQYLHLDRYLDARTSDDDKLKIDKSTTTKIDKSTKTKIDELEVELERFKKLEESWKQKEEAWKKEVHSWKQQVEYWKVEIHSWEKKEEYWKVEVHSWKTKAESWEKKLASAAEKLEKKVTEFAEYKKCCDCDCDIKPNPA